MVDFYIKNIYNIFKEVLLLTFRNVGQRTLHYDTNMLHNVQQHTLYFETNTFRNVGQRTLLALY